LYKVKLSQNVKMAGAASGIFSSFLAAIQASLSVLLVLFYGSVAAHYRLLDKSSAKVISKICVKLFLPALLLTQIGSELHSGSATRYGIILIWAFIAHFVSFLIGSLAHLLLGMPDWITVAIMFNNTTSYPLLLVQALDQTGILSSLIVTDETTKAAIERAKSYFLVFATVSSCLTFAVGPRLIDSEHAPEPEEEDAKPDDGESADEEQQAGTDERTALINRPDQDPFRRRASKSFFPSSRTTAAPAPEVVYDRRPSLVTRRRWLTLSPRTKWWLLFIADFFNAPLLGAVLGAIIGLVPALHVAFFSGTKDGGIFTAWLTASFKTVGSLFVPLPVLVAGVSLYLATRRPASEQNRDSSLSYATTAFILGVRFVLWPVLSIGLVYLLCKKTTWLGDDPMLWFALMLMPTGPPAMKLITMIEISDADEDDEHKIAKLLTASNF
jgi:auxin efflux carrier family protein